MPYNETNKERGPLPGLLAVDYFTTSPGGNPRSTHESIKCFAQDARAPPGDTTAHQLVSTHGQ